jgi:hypothetical protein
MCWHVVLRLCFCCMPAGLEEGSRLPAAVQVDPGAASNAGAAAELQQVPSSLPGALKCWAADTKLQVSGTQRGRTGFAKGACHCGSMCCLVNRVDQSRV